MKKTLITCLLFLSLTGCSTTDKYWTPNSVYVENSTYDNGEHTYHEAGLSGNLGNTDITLDIFTVISPSTSGDRENYWGGGFRLDIPIK